MLMVVTAKPWAIDEFDVSATLAGAGTTVIEITLMGRSSRRAGIDMRELARVVLHGRYFEYTGFRPRHAGDPVKRYRQIVSIQAPHQFRFRRNRVRRCHRHLAPADQLDRLPLALAIRQVENQAIARLGRGLAVQGNDLAGNRRHQPAHWPPCNQLVSNRDHIPRQRDTPGQARSERHRPILGIGQQRTYPGAAPLIRRCSQSR